MKYIWQWAPGALKNVVVALAVLGAAFSLMGLLPRVGDTSPPEATEPPGVLASGSGRAAQPDFSLGISPAEQAVSAGNAATYKVTVTALNGFNLPVTLSVPRIPQGMAVRFATNPVTPTVQVELRAETAVAVPAGTYTMTLAAEGPGGDPLHSVPFRLVVLPESLYIRILKFLLTGVGVTLEITVLGILLSLIIGLLVGMARTAKNPIIYGISTFYVEVIRGIPLLVLLFYVYFALGDLTARLLGAPIDPVPAAILGMGICYGAYMGETYRAGIQSIHKGQMEAARSLGMSYLQAMRYIILPQAIRRILPPLGNDFVAMLKDSSLASVVSVEELSRKGREFTMTFFRPFETWNMVALLYFIMTFIFSRVIRYVEGKMAAGE